MSEPQQTNVYARANSPRLIAKASFVAIPVHCGDSSWHTAGILNIPYAASLPCPAVLILHGSGGVDSRGAHYADAFNRAGLATLELDLWAPRGVQGSGGRPQHVRETLPDAFAALHLLARMNGIIDADRIGVTGFSWGGIVSMLSATQANRDAFAIGAERFAAHAPFYPVCWVYNTVPGYEFSGLTGAPIFIQTGDADEYDSPGRDTALIESLSVEDRAHVALRSHVGATHGWERREPDVVGFDSYAHDGAGGDVPVRYSEEATRTSTEAVVDFFIQTLGAAR